MPFTITRRVEFGDTDIVLDFAAMSGIAGLTGSIEPRAEGNVYGAWESADNVVDADRTAARVASASCSTACAEACARL